LTRVDPFYYRLGCYLDALVPEVDDENYAEVIVKDLFVTASGQLGCVS
jgi:hypothetical protein